MSDLKGRVITAIILGVIIIISLYGHPYSLCFLFFLTNAFSLWEYGSIIFKNNNDNVLEKLGLVGIGSMIYLILSGIFLNFLPAYYLTFLLPLSFLLFIKEMYIPSEHPFTRLAMQITALVHVSFALSLVNYIANYEGFFSPNKIMGIFLLVWANDVFAYFVGRKLGKHSLFKRISPKKTWEGSIGGALGCLLVAFLLTFIFPDLSTTQWLFMAIIVAIFGSLGDLVESLLKRSMKIKDSGTLLPHHGGFLDRFDALIFCLPFLFSFLYVWHQTVGN